MPRPGLLKRKRRSFDLVANIENEPINEEKRAREDRSHDDVAGGTSEEEKRLPLSELSVLQVTSSSKENTEFDRLSLSDCEENYIHGALSDLELTPSAKRRKKENVEDADYLADTRSVVSVFRKSSSVRPCPIPKLSWTFETELWTFYCQQDNHSVQTRSSNLFANHPNLQPRMRSVLLEWILEVCDVYKMHRESYYLAMDYLDRYLSITKNVPKVKLQLIGITCLLIASKVEEVYPPKVAEFAYVTDGACTEDDILKTELEIMWKLNWDCATVTPNGWLSIFMQVFFSQPSGKELDLISPLFPNKIFISLAQLLDLSTLDVGCLQFSYSTLAASAMYIILPREKALSATGYQCDEIIDCVNWMEPFWLAIIEAQIGLSPISEDKIPTRKNGTFDFTYAHQTHNVSMELLEAGQAILELKAGAAPSCYLTPPASSSKRGGVGGGTFAKSLQCSESSVLLSP